MSRNIARFEQLAYLGLIIAVFQAPLELLRATGEMQGTASAVSAAKIIAILGEALGILIGWLPIWLVARRGKIWARWIFLAVYGGALAFCVANFGQAGRLFDFLNTLQAVFWTGALFFVFAGGAQDRVEQPASAPLVGDTPPATRTRTRVMAGRREVMAPSELDHRGKVDAHVAEMGKAGIAGFVSAPPPFRLLWSMGAGIPPPLFLGFVPVMLIAGAPFVVVGMLLNAFMAWVDLVSSFVVSAWLSLLIGALVAAYYRRQLQSLSLPSWEHYLPARQAAAGGDPSRGRADPRGR